MKTNGKEIVGFSFQIIPLEEAKQAAIAGSGNYAELKSKLLEVIPTLKENESFAFGLPKGEVPEDQRRGIVTALSSTLKKAKHPWRVTYSGVKRLFICIPSSMPRTYIKQTNGSKDNFHIAPSIERLVKTCLKLWDISEANFKDRKTRKLAPMRKAMQYVGNKKLRLKQRELGDYFGTSDTAVAFNVSHLNELDRMRIQELTLAIQGG